MLKPRVDSNIFVRRNSKYDEHKDDFPTPPWAVRAFFQYVAPELKGQKLLFNEPACGRGFMVKVLKEQKFKVMASDLIDYKKGFKVENYLTSKSRRYDIMLTNPPYKYANQFVLKALGEAEVGVAILLRTIWLESVTRYDQLFDKNPPTRVAVFSRRMQAAHGKLVRGGGAMMSHSWFWWNKRMSRGTPPELTWIPPTAQFLLDRDSDYA